MTHPLHTLAACALAAAFTLQAQAASAPDPGDYTPAPAGVTLGILYAQRVTADKVYADGNKVVDNLGLGLDIGIARLVHFIDVGGMPADLQLILPFGRQTIDLADYRESGVGNVIFGGTLWTMSDAKAGQHLGWSAFLSLPTGQKRDKGFFASDDRYALDLQAAYTTRLSESFSIDLIGQGEFYTRDKTTEVSRDPLVRGFAHLSYHYSPATRFAFSVRQAMGAKETLDGTTVTGSKQDTQLMLTWSSFILPNFQAQVQYVQDVKVRNAALTSGVQTRFVYAF